MQETNGILGGIRVLPVVVMKKIEDTIPTLRALCEGGIYAAEITFRTACAEEAIRIGSAAFPQMQVGAGTVLCEEQAQEAIAAGAKFIVSPGLSAGTAELCRSAGIPYIPGCVTPTEIMQALALGLHTVKFFPAGIYGGLEAIRALAAPFPQVKFLPTGGVNYENLREYLENEHIAAVGGSFMMTGNIFENCRKIQEVLR